MKDEAGRNPPACRRPGAFEIGPQFSNMRRPEPEAERRARRIAPKALVREDLPGELLQGRNALSHEWNLGAPASHAEEFIEIAWPVGRRQHAKGRLLGIFR